MQTHSFTAVPVTRRHANAGGRARGCRAGLSSTNPATSAQPNGIPDLILPSVGHFISVTAHSLHFYHGQIWFA